MCVSSLSLALVLPDYSMHYIKAKIGDTITQAKCKCHLNHFNLLVFPLSFSFHLYVQWTNVAAWKVTNVSLLQYCSPYKAEKHSCLSLLFLSITYNAPCSYTYARKKKNHVFLLCGNTHRQLCGYSNFLSKDSGMCGSSVPFHTYSPHQFIYSTSVCVHPQAYWIQH